MIEILEQHLPTELAQRILQYHSHPMADMMGEVIDEWHYYRKRNSISRLLTFPRYMTNKMTLKHARWEQHYLMNDIDDNFDDEHLSYVPYDHHPEDCTCDTHNRWPHLRRARLCIPN